MISEQQQNQQQNQAIIDWISFSLPVSLMWYDKAINLRQDVHSALVELFGPCMSNPIATVGRGSFYREKYVIRDTNGKPLVTVYTCPTTAQSSNTTAFSVSGYALSRHSQLMANFDPISLLHKIKAMKGRLTRLDLALDIFDNPKLLPSIFDASRPSVWEQRIVSRLRFEKPMPVGWENETIYFNRRTDETCICCYDKAKEQNIEGVWTRLEFRSRNRKLLANVLAELTAGRAVGQVTARLLGDYLKFVGPGDGNKYRKPVATWWAKVIKEGQGFEFQRHSLGKLDEDGNEHNSPKKCGKTVDQVTRYLKDACRYADLGMMDEIGTVFAQIRYDKQLEIELEKMW